MSRPLASESFSMTVTLLTVSESEKEWKKGTTDCHERSVAYAHDTSSVKLKQKISFLYPKTKLTIFVSHRDRLTADGLKPLLSPKFEVDRLLVEDNVILQNVLGKVRHGEGKKAPIQWLPALKSRVSWYENDEIILSIYREFAAREEKLEI